MNHIKQAERKLSETAAYRYIVGALFAIIALLKKGVKAFLKHSIEILTAAAFISVIAVTNLFDSGKVPLGMVILLLLILVVMVCMFIRIKIFKE